MIINQKITDDIKSSFQRALEIEDKYEKLKKWKKLEKFTPGIKRK